MLFFVFSLVSVFLNAIRQIICIYTFRTTKCVGSESFTFLCKGRALQASLSFTISIRISNVLWRAFFSQYLVYWSRYIRCVFFIVSVHFCILLFLFLVFEIWYDHFHFISTYAIITYNFGTSATDSFLWE